MSQEAEARPKLHIIGLHECRPCEELKEQVEKEDVKKALMEKFGTDEVDVLYADEDSDGGNKARNICYSIDKFSSPILVLEKQVQEKTRICLINDDLEEERCGELRGLPT